MADAIVPRRHEDTWAATLLAVGSRRRWAAFCLAVPLSATLSAAAFLPNRYRSVALVVVERAPLSAVPASTPVPASTEAQVQRLHEENLSRSRLRGLIEQHHLYPELAGKGSLEATIDQMRRDNIRIESKDAEHAGGRSLVAFQISFRGREPERVAQVTNSLASFYVDRSRAQREEQAKSVIAMLEDQVAQVKLQLDDQGRKVNDFISLHLHELPYQVPMNLARLERLNALLVRNRDARVRSIRERALETAAETADGSDAQLAQLTERLGTLRGHLTDQHPDVAALKAEIATLTETAESRRSAPPRAGSRAKTAGGGPPAPGAEGERKVLENIAATEKNVYNAAKRERELDALLAPYQTTRQIYNSLLARLEDARLAAGVEAQQVLNPVRILDPAVAAREPIAPNRLRLLVAGLVASVLFAVMAVLVAERLDTSFHSLDDLRAFTRVPVLASVPKIVSSRDRARRRRRSRWAVVLLVLLVGATGAGTYAMVHDNESLVRMLTRDV